MPKNKHSRASPGTNIMVYPDTSINQHLAYVEKAWGSCQFLVKTKDGDGRTCSLSGLLKRRRVILGDLVLIEQLTDDETGKYQAIFKYNPKQRKIWEKEGYLKVATIQNEEKKEENDFFFEGEIEEKNEKELAIDETFIDDI